MQWMTTQSRICLSWVWCLSRCHFGCAICEANWILLRCGPKMVTGIAGCRAFWEGLWCNPMSDVTCDWPWETCLELQSNPEFVAASAGFWLGGGRAKLCTKAGFDQHQAQRLASKTPKTPGDSPLLPSPAGCLIG